MKHILIVGKQGVGKSTLINKLIKEFNLSVSGFETKKEDGLRNELGTPVYIYPALKKHVQTKGNLVAYRQCPNKQTFIEAFEKFATILEKDEESDVILMDEIGFLETSAKSFCDVVLDKFNGNRPIIAAVKDMDIDFLNVIKNHPNSKCFYINEDNRDSLYKEVCAYYRENNLI